MKKNKQKVGMMITGAVLIILAAAVAAYNYCRNARASENIQSVVPVAEEIISAYNNVPQTYTQVGGALDSSEPFDAPCVEINGNSYIGVLKIPSLNITLPILSGHGEKNLDLAPCRYTDCINFTIEGKNYDSHFGRLDSLAEGDQIIFTDFLGRVYKYRVSKSNIVSKDEKFNDLPQERGLTLIRDTELGFKRLVIFCDVDSYFEK